MVYNRYVHFFAEIKRDDKSTLKTCLLIMTGKNGGPHDLFVALSSPNADYLRAKAKYIADCFGATLEWRFGNNITIEGDE